MLKNSKTLKNVKLFKIFEYFKKFECFKSSEFIIFFLFFFEIFEFLNIFRFFQILNFEFFLIFQNFGKFQKKKLMDQPTWFRYIYHWPSHNNLLFLELVGQAATSETSPRVLGSCDELVSLLELITTKKHLKL